MGNYEIEKSFSCTVNAEKVRYVTPGISKMEWTEGDAVYDADWRKFLCAQKKTLPPWPGM